MFYCYIWTTLCGVVYIAADSLKPAQSIRYTTAEVCRIIPMYARSMMIISSHEI